MRSTSPEHAPESMPGREGSGNEDQRHSTFAVHCAGDNAGNPAKRSTMHAITNRADCSIVFEQYVQYVRGSFFVPDQEYQDRDAEATPSVPPRASFDRSAWQCVVLLDVALDKQLAISWRGEVSRAGVFGVHLHEIEDAHAREEIRTDLMARLRFHFVQCDLATKAQTR